MTISFEGRVAIVTGAGGGLGRAYALELARRGAKVVVNDLGGGRDGTGHSDAALAVVEEIKAAGGEAMADGGNVTDHDQMAAMVAKANAAWGGVHILINNAGILRDKSFAKMEHGGFPRGGGRPSDRLGQRHQGGVGDDARAGLWPDPDDRARRPASTAISARPITAPPSSASPASPRRWRSRARKYNVRVNTIAPTAATRMTEDLFPPELLEPLPARAGRARRALPGLRGRADRRDPRRRRGRRPGGLFTLTRGVALDEATPEAVAANWAAITDRAGEIVPAIGRRAGDDDPPAAAGTADPRRHHRSVLQF